MTEFYDIRQEGHKEAWDTTPGATPADWDQALQIAQDRARERGRNYVIRHVSRDGARLIVTATPEGLAWPKIATPVLPLPEPVPNPGWELMEEPDTGRRYLAPRDVEA